MPTILVQGQGATCGNGLLVGRVLMCHGASQGKSQGVHVCMCALVSPSSHDITRTQ
jgi:hypothetical protein